MTLPASAPITLQQIQTEYGTSGLRASSTAAGLDPLPTSMLDFLGKSAVNSTPVSLSSFNLVDSTGGTSAGYNTTALIFDNNGTIYCNSQMEGNYIPTSYYVPAGYYAPSAWLTSNVAITSAMCAAYDIQFDEVSFSSSGRPIHALTYGSGGRQYGSGGTGVRLNLGTARYFQVNAAATQFATTSPSWGDWTSIVTVDVKIYLTGTNTLKSSNRISLEVYIPPGTTQ